MQMTMTLMMMSTTLHLLAARQHRALVQAAQQVLVLEEASQ